MYHTKLFLRWREEWLPLSSQTLSLGNDFLDGLFAKNFVALFRIVATAVRELIKKVSRINDTITLITQNIRDFEGIVGLKLIDWTATS